MSDHNETAGAATYASGITWLSLLTIVFIVLKLTGVISWSWLWILSPIWIPNLITFLLVVVAFIIISVKENKKNP